MLLTLGISNGKQIPTTSVIPNSQRSPTRSESVSTTTTTKIVSAQASQSTSAVSVSKTSLLHSELSQEPKKRKIDNNNYNDDHAASYNDKASSPSKYPQKRKPDIITKEVRHKKIFL
jgi:hypothetical protein